MIQSFADTIQQHKDEIAAIGFFYQQPYQRRALTLTCSKTCTRTFAKTTADAHHRAL